MRTPIYPRVNLQAAARRFGGGWEESFFKANGEVFESSVSNSPRRRLGADFVSFRLDGLR